MPEFLYLDIETIGKPGNDDPKAALNGATAEVCCIGWAWNDHQTEARICPGDETECLRSAMESILSDKPDNYQRVAVAGHNVARFDIRFLWQRAFVLGVKMPAWFPRDPKPWGLDVHDTMAMWAGAGGFISLDKLCSAMGLPGKGNMSGADVAGLWAKAEYGVVADYCRADVDRVRSVHRKMLVSMGEVA